MSYLEELASLYSTDPDAIDPSWQYFFDGMSMASTNAPQDTKTQDQFRSYGHLIASTNPLKKPEPHPLFEGLQQNNKALFDRMHEIYAGNTGLEYMHILEPSERTFIEELFEKKETPSPQACLAILKILAGAEAFEKFLHTRYVAQKRFSIEGGDGLLVVLDALFQTGASLGVDTFIMGMAHRGRLTVLTEVFGKDPASIFAEFEGKAHLAGNSEGDVKYHMGYSTDKEINGKKIHLSLASNPSHLEFVNPVVEGIARAKQDQSDASRVAPILVHGDAAFAGQGVCFETLALAGVRGYSTGGTIHIVVNNQIGFTTNPSDSRGTRYSTDLAKMLEIPIFHINGDNPEELARCAQIAAKYRQRFKKDVVIEIVCYRRHGHNEGDEPTFTQPGLYVKIKDHKSPFFVYSELLEKRGVHSNNTFLAERTEELISAQQRLRALTTPYELHIQSMQGAWTAFERPPIDEYADVPCTTGVLQSQLLTLGEKITKIPSSFHLHPKLERFFEGRIKALRDGHGIDWGNAETLAFASLLESGTPVRLSGQDVGRGTFSHRHAMLTDAVTDMQYSPLSELGRFSLFNSPLSETGVLGFEYGYSLADPKTLTIWEAQFGDFANGAQVIIDQFISASASKWQRMSGVTLLLPHGYEGQGPEHSSARLERYLQLAGRGNMAICVPSTPAQIFHILRRQALSHYRRPLIIISPKSLLRHPQAVSKLADLEAPLQLVIDDKNKDATRIALCSGKVYYDLLAQRPTETNLALIRIEQLYPWPKKALDTILALYPRAKKLVWVQEEPQNMGAWQFVSQHLPGITYCGRDIGASPAVGSHKMHELQQEHIVKTLWSEGVV